jgi:dihydrofolate reductase
LRQKWLPLTLFAGPNGEIYRFVAHTGDQEESKYAIDSLKSTNTLLFGRVTYALMASYWPTADAMNNDPLLAERMNNQPKIVFSRMLDKVEWQNTKLVKDNIEEEIQKMKNQPGKDMAILGSGSIVSAFAQRGLIDEYSINGESCNLRRWQVYIPGHQGQASFETAENKDV